MILQRTGMGLGMPHQTGSPPTLSRYAFVVVPWRWLNSTSGSRTVEATRRVDTFLLTGSRAMVASYFFSGGGACAPGGGPACCSSGQRAEAGSVRRGQQGACLSSRMHPVMPRLADSAEASWHRLPLALLPPLVGRRHCGRGRGHSTRTHLSRGVCAGGAGDHPATLLLLLPQLPALAEPAVAGWHRLQASGGHQHRRCWALDACTATMHHESCRLGRQGSRQKELVFR